MRRIIAAAGLLILLASAGQAQAPSPDLKSGAKQTPAAAPKGAPDKTTDAFGDWSVVCITQAAGEKVCEVDAALTIRGQTSPVAQISFVRAARDQPMRLVALVPVNVAIKGGVRIQTADKTLFTLPFTTCVQAACIAEIELTKEQVAHFHGQSQPGQIILDDPSGKPAALQVSFKGLDQALDSFLKRQEK
ncbi:invasion associated locus B family protein [Methylocapsa palsarum]|uniref:Invasion protein IalB, involved in pathogenesis n=1 Tax=Methylocapsa palsarum TaxID=1612308 RepID=A0A1I3WYC1_9HYPH|nr:invasion associated locus B family protein [Methylocapsa palsarum]SFK11917.1 Invasion protein IalB, involved in pathogenesis [Methylocapsa palsarum]